MTSSDNLFMHSFVNISYILKLL